MAKDSLLERMESDWLDLSRSSFDRVEAGIAANTCQEAMDEIGKLRNQLVQAREAMIKRFLNTIEAADFLRCHRNYLEKLRCTGGGPVYVKMRGKVLYDVADLDAWISGLKCSSTSDVREVGHHVLSARSGRSMATKPTAQIVRKR